MSALFFSVCLLFTAVLVTVEVSDSLDMIAVADLWLVLRRGLTIGDRLLVLSADRERI